MNRSSFTRIIAVVLAIVSMLCMQFALATYVCPGMAQNGAIMMTDSGSVEMPGCDGMDVKQAALCHAHAQDQSSKQTFDKTDFPPVTPFINGQLVLTLTPVIVLSPSHRLAYSLKYPAHSPAPPIAILHCCWRV